MRQSILEFHHVLVTSDQISSEALAREIICDAVMEAVVKTFPVLSYDPNNTVDNLSVNIEFSTPASDPWELVVTATVLDKGGS